MYRPGSRKGIGIPVEASLKKEQNRRGEGGRRGELLPVPRNPKQGYSLQTCQILLAASGKDDTMVVMISQVSED